MSVNTELFSKLSNLAHQINESTDGVNAAIEKFEAKLHDLNLGVSTWVEPGGAELHDCEFDWSGWQIGWGKIGGDWRLVARKVEGYDSATYEAHRFSEPERALRDAPRDVRMELVSRFDTLTAALIEAAQAKLRVLDDATDSVLMPEPAPLSSEVKRSDEARQMKANFQKLDRAKSSR